MRERLQNLQELHIIFFRSYTLANKNMLNNKTSSSYPCTRPPLHSQCIIKTSVFLNEFFGDTKPLELVTF